MNCAVKIILIFFLVNIFLTGCDFRPGGRSSLSTLSTKPTTLAQTPISTPLVTKIVETKNHWTAGPVIAMISRRSLECFYCYFSDPPEVILYSDGRQIVVHEMYLYERRLHAREFCELMSEIDRNGFFEYTSGKYEEFYKSNNLKPAPEYYLINIDAWKSNSLNLLGFGFLYSQYKYKVEWPVELSIPYEKLTEFDFNSMRPYLPERVAVHIEKDPNFEFELGIWEISSPSLADLIARYNEISTPESESSEGELILFGDEAEAVLKQFNERPWGAKNIFLLNNERYLVAIRALLPYETSGGRDQMLPLIPDPNTEYPPMPMSCPDY